MLELLMGADIGTEYLKDNKFITSIAEMLKTEIDASQQEVVAMASGVVRLFRMSFISALVLNPVY